MKNEYNIAEAFAKIENELLTGMIKNMKRHQVEEIDEGLQWEQWQALQLKALDDYRKKNSKKYGPRFKEINRKIDEGIREMKASGMSDQEIEILDAIKRGAKLKRDTSTLGASFFRTDEAKLDALINAVTNDFEKAERAVLRRSNDIYRKTIYNAQMYAASGAATYEKAVDMATKDFIKAGVNCVEYKNGARHTLSDYARMAIRTANKRAYLQGQAVKREEWGVHTVIVNKRTNPCPKCLPFIGKILIDDVYGSGTNKESQRGKYKLLSSAMAAGFLHPNCKDAYTTYFPELEEEDNKLTKKDVEEAAEDYKQEQLQSYRENQANKYTRLAEHSIDPENRAKYEAKADAWKSKANPQVQLSSLYKEFEEMTEGYSYNDFMNDFGSIENGFEGSEDVEIIKAKSISDKIEKLKKQLDIKPEKVIPTKDEAIKTFANLGIKFVDKSSEPISDEVSNLLANFVDEFERGHVGFFKKNKTPLNEIHIVDSVAGEKFAGGKYSNKGKNLIQIRRKSIKSNQDSLLSKSDDYRLHNIVHEYGHYIADAMEKTLGITEHDIVQSSIVKYFDGDIFKSSKDLKDALSAYGSSSNGEAFAEAFAEAYTSEKPGAFASIFKEELEAKIGKTFTSRDNSHIIKAIDVDDFQARMYGENIQEEVQERLIKCIKNAELENGFIISNVSKKIKATQSIGTDVLQIEPLGNGLLQLNVNIEFFSNKTLKEINDGFKNSKRSVANSLEEAVIHESGHAKLIKGLLDKEIIELYEEIEPQVQEGISKIAAEDGVEALAELEVLRSRRTEVSNELKAFYEKYMKEAW